MLLLQVFVCFFKISFEQFSIYKVTQNERCVCVCVSVHLKKIKYLMMMAMIMIIIFIIIIAWVIVV